MPVTTNPSTTENIARISDHATAQAVSSSAIPGLPASVERSWDSRTCRGHISSRYQWLMFGDPQIERAYLDYFTSSYRRFDATVMGIYIVIGISWMSKAHQLAEDPTRNPWLHPTLDTASNCLAIVVHGCLALHFLADSAFIRRHRHDVVTLWRIICSLFMMQGQMTLIKLAGKARSWQPVVVNVLGWGTGSTLCWNALMQRLPFNRSLPLSLLQFICVFAQNGPIVAAMQQHFGDKLDAGGKAANMVARQLLGPWWPEVSGAAYFAVLFCGTRQIAWFCWVVLLPYRLEVAHRQQFIVAAGLSGSSKDVTFERVPRLGALLLAAQVITIAAVLSIDLTSLYHGTVSGERVALSHAALALPGSK